MEPKTTITLTGAELSVTLPALAPARSKTGSRYRLDDAQRSLHVKCIEADARWAAKLLRPGRRR